MAKIVRNNLVIWILLAILAGSAAPLSGQDSTLLLERKKHSPTGALLRSMAVPGWGQLYNGKWFKAILIGGLESVLIYQTAHYWERTSTYEDLYLNDSTSTRYGKFLQYDRYRDLRNQYIWILGITIFYSMFDAYVDAHLKNFDVDITPDFDEERRDLTLWLKIGYCY